MKKLIGSLRRVLSWHRRAIAAFAAALGTLAFLSAVSPDDVPTQQVVVAKRRIPAGQQMTSDDLRTAQIPNEYIPEGYVTDIGAVTGRMPIAELPPNSVVASASVFTPGELHPARGKAIMPLRLPDDGLHDLLRPGVVVDLVGVSSSTGNAQIIARDVRIVTVPSAENQNGAGPSGRQGTLVIVEVALDSAAALSTAAMSSTISVILR